MGVTRLRDGLSAVLAVVVLVTALVLLPASPASSAVGDFGNNTGSGSAVMADAGAGRYKDRIVWINWGALGSQVTAKTVRTWQQVGPTTRLEVDCTLSNIVADQPTGLQVYRGRTGVGTGFEELYRTGGRGTSNTLIAGLMGHEATFTVACANARVAIYPDTTFTTPTSTKAVTLAGMVVADAETTNYTTTEREWVRAEAFPAENARWRVIDAYGGTCNGTYTVYRDSTVPNPPAGTGNRLNMSAATAECPTTPSATAVGLTDRTQLNLTLDAMNFGGQQAIAIGYVLGVDYGDAPASYGVAGAVAQPPQPWVGGNTLSFDAAVPTVIVNAGVVQANEFSTISTPPIRLGSQVFTNLTPPYSADASGDVGWAVPPATAVTADENGLSGAPPPITVVRGVTTTYTSPSVACVGTGSVQGWLDWDRSGTFETDEGSNVVTCPGGNGSVTLNFTIPADVPNGVAAGGDRTFLRLEIAPTAAELAPLGILSQGEVEDWPVLLQVPRLQVTKTADVPAVPAAGGVVTYTVVATNVGNGPYTAAAPAWVYDYYGAALDDATLTSFSSVPTGVFNDAANSLLTWTGPLAAGAQVTFTVRMTVRAAPGDLVMSNAARVSNVFLPPASANVCVAGSADQLALICARVDLYRAAMTMTKRAFLATDTTFTNPLPSSVELPPGTAVVWRYTLTNTGSVALTNVTLTDAATDSRTDAAGTTTTNTNPTITCPGTPTVVPGGTVTIPTLAAGASRICQATGTVGGT